MVLLSCSLHNLQTYPASRPKVLPMASPNWNKVFTKMKEQKKGKVTVSFCGNYSLGCILKLK